MCAVVRGLAGASSVMADTRHQDTNTRHISSTNGCDRIPRYTNVSLYVCVSHLLQLTMTAWDYMTCMVLRVYSSRSLRELLILSLHNHQLRNCFFSSLLTWLYPSCSDLQCQCRQMLDVQVQWTFSLWWRAQLSWSFWLHRDPFLWPQHQHLQSPVSSLQCMY